LCDNQFDELERRRDECFRVNDDGVHDGGCGLDGRLARW
jgi:hypothetical protein